MQKIFLYGFPVLALILVGSFLYLTRLKPVLSPVNSKLPAINTSNNSEPGAPVSKPPAADFSSLEASAIRFQGTIAKIEGQILTVNGRPIYNQTAQASNSAIQTGPFVNARVTVNSGIEIKRPSKIKSATASANVSLQDLKVGQLVLISSQTDLKGLKTAGFTAKTITLLPENTSIIIRGKIPAIYKNSFIVETPLRNYEIIITKETSIFTGNKDKIKKLTRADLKIGQDVIVNTEDDPMSAAQITAVKIELPSSSQ